MFGPWKVPLGLRAAPLILLWSLQGSSKPSTASETLKHAEKVLSEVLADCNLSSSLLNACKGMFETCASLSLGLAEETIQQKLAEVPTALKPEPSAMDEQAPTQEESQEG